jgi:catalase
VTAYAFTNAGGETRFGRYRIIPETGNDFLSDDQAAKLSANYHFDEIAERIGKGPVRFRIMVQIAAPDDVTDDATVHWPESREVVDFGTLELNAVMPESIVEQKHIIFDPVPRVDGIESSADPLLELRAAAYLLSGRQRRAAKS